jgi:hypothetical protein
MKVHNPLITGKRTPRFKDNKGVKLFLSIAIEAKINVEIIYYQITIVSRPKKEERFYAYIITLIQLHKQKFSTTGG